MKGLLLFGLFFLPMLSNAQVKMDFNSPEWSQGWSGDLEKFTISSGKLQSASSISNDTFSIFYLCDLPQDWQIRLECLLDFNTSSVNYIDIVLPGKGDTSLFLRIGGSADELSLWSEYPHFEKIAATAQGTTERSSWIIDILQNSMGNIVMQAQHAVTTVKYEIETPISLIPIGIGIRIRQSTASFFNKHRFDDLYLGPRIVDRIAPAVAKTSLQNKDLLRIELSEYPDSLSSARTCTVAGTKCAVHYTRSGHLLIPIGSLELENNTPIRIELNHILDHSGNALDTLIQFHYLYGEIPDPGSLIFTEIMPDPSPPIALPEVEFVELTNIGTNYLSTLGLLFSDATSSVILPEHILPPNTSIILCREQDTGLFVKHSTTLGLAAWPSLNNSSDSLKLSNSTGERIDQLYYNTESRSGTFKSEGGWSLELSNLKHACLGFEAWDYSKSPSGGSPGTFDPDPNIRHPSDLQILSWNWMGDRVIQFSLNGVLEAIPDECSVYFSDLGTIYPRSSIAGDRLSIELPISPNPGIPGELRLKVSDCIGRSMDTTFSVGRALRPTPGSVLVSEILFNPTTGGADFVEIYNPSEMLIDASELFVFSRDSNAMFSHYKPITVETCLLPPASYTAFSSNPDWLRSQYKPPENSRIQQTKFLPTLPDKSGNIGLANVSGEELDYLEYSDAMHSLLLKTIEGVSLERVDLQLGPTVSRIWKSASSSVGFATPGYMNSRSFRSQANVQCEVSPRQFSPNNDGVSDYVQINWNTNGIQDVSLHIEVFDRLGNFITSIRNGELIAESELILWDGTTEEGFLLDPGDYILWILARFADGSDFRQKVPLVLIR